ncbi:ABC transporter ATP-binding protein [Candidatus Hydrogenedentota bacterium]
MAGDYQAVEIRGVSKRYPLRRESKMLVGEILSVIRRRKKEQFWALKNIDISVGSGETLGIIGPNGSGKSTLLKIISGMTTPSGGSVSVNGRVSSLLELGAGFHPYLSGHENVYLNGSLLGIPRHIIDRDFDKIVEFAGLARKFINQPVKDYSSGMYLRLAFAVAAFSNPEVLITDEILSVGDESFQRKCKGLLRDFIKQGKTIILVSHDMSMIRDLCDRVILLRHGKIIADGPSSKVVNYYLRSLGEENAVADLRKGPLRLNFNYGRLLIFVDDQECTSANGIVTTYTDENGEHHSPDAEWTVTRTDEKKIVIMGSWHGMPITERWIVEIMDEKTVHWTIEAKLEGAVETLDQYTHGMFNTEYSQWITSREMGYFPDITSADREFQIQSSYLPARDLFALRGETSLPSLEFSFRDDGKHNQLSFHNTNFQNLSRFVRIDSLDIDSVKSANDDWFSVLDATIRVASDDQRFEALSASLGKTLVAGPMQISFAGGRIHVRCNGNSITKGKGLYTVFWMDEEWLDSPMALWTVVEHDETSIVAEGSWFGHPLKQVWRITTEGDSQFRWEVDTVFERETANTELFVRGDFVTAYEDWLTDREAGPFPVIEPRDSIWRDLTPWLQGRPIAAMGSASEEAPDIKLELPDTGLNPYVRFHNSDYDTQFRLLEIRSNAVHRGLKLKAGVHPSFVGDWKLLPDKSHLDACREAIASYDLVESGGARTRHQEGRGMLNWFEQTLTLKHGLYTSIRSEGQWQDSGVADWKYERTDSGGLLAAGRWQFIPITQKWHMRAIEPGTIELSVTLIVLEPLRMDRWQTNIMLDNKFIHWALSDARQGEMPRFSADVDDEWEQVACLDGASGSSARLADGAGTTVAMKVASGFSASNQTLGVVNSDLSFSGRLIQILRRFPAAESRFEPGEYHYSCCWISVSSIGQDCATPTEAKE